MSKKVRRLYEQFQPEQYDLVLSLDREAMTFSGQVTIKGRKTGRPSQRLTFHQKELKITATTVVKHDKKGDHELTINRINNHNSFDEVRLHAGEMVYPGSYTVTMEFAGKITKPMNGIYPCYFKHGGQEKMLLATQFESHHAREAFPCIDEPEAKATFDLTLETVAGETVIANTPVKTQQTSGQKLTTVFETTPKMSSYLLALVTGEMGYKEAETKDGVLVRTYATPDNVDYTDFALDCAVKTLEFYNEYFDIAYPLAKCDFIALPDFASGAMENWGCITFREQALLVDPQNTSLHLKQWVANVVAHELTHQWFGNLVTMRWWTDLWLNESFASWMSYLAVDQLFPDWQVWTQFIADEQSLGLRLDALQNTHPIQVEINHPDEIRTIFDAISYEKGASVLLMLHNYLGADNFRDGLRVYLKRHAYGNTDTIDLWKALEEASKKPVQEFMGAWTGQSGFPIVRAEVGSGQMTIQQERFYLNPKADKQPATWPIPLLAYAPLDADTANDSEQSVKIMTSDEAQYAILNHDRTGFYRVTYDAAHLAKLTKAVQAGELTVLDRYGLLSDAFEAAKAGYAPTVEALKLLEAYRGEDNVIVWGAISDALGSIRNVMQDEKLRDAMKPYICQLVQAQLQRLGWEERAGDSHFDRLLRPIILSLASFGEDKDVVAEAKKRFAAAKKSEDIHPDLRGVVYGTVARTSGPAEFDKLLEMHNASQSSEERVTLAAALCGFKQPALIKRTLELITSDKVRLQDASYWIAYSFGNRHAKQTTWQWVQGHWDWLERNMGSDLSFYRLPNYVARAFSDETFLPEFRKFFESHMSTAFERPVKQAVETIQWQAAWKQRDLMAIKTYFKA
ncbi:MAG TPA: M1 family metallopeptidase [Candidatus Saccharimonadales bacterium]|nr:M1 family metallopeptidase [Candidatus Saccharimonadales bacterium]